MKAAPASLDQFDLRRGLHLVVARKPCGRTGCKRCVSGQQHGPYSRLVGRGYDGRLHQTAVSPADRPLAQQVVAAVRAALATRRLPKVPRAARSGPPLVYHDGDLLEYLGLRRAKGRLIEVRSFPAERRWQNEYVLLDGAYRAIFSEAEYVALRRQATALRKRGNRLRQPFDEAGFWKDTLTLRTAEKLAGVL